MRSTLLADEVQRGLILMGAVFLAAPVSAEKRLVRHFPAPRWCSYVSGHSTPLDLLTPYTFTPPGNRVTLVFKADNRNALNNAWNNQRLDEVVVLRTADLPPGSEPSCFLPIYDPSDPFDPGTPPQNVQAFPPSGGPSVFRDDFAGGARPEWGVVPAGSGDGTAPAPVFRLPTSSDGTAVSSDLLTEDFEDGLGQGWTSAALPGATNLWRPAATDCQPLAGARHLAFGRPDPACSYDAGVQGRVGGTYTSPLIDLSYVDTIANPPTLSFSHRWVTAGQSAQWVVETSEDGGGTWTSALESSLGIPNSFGVVPEQLVLSSQSPQFRVRFRFDSGSSATEAGDGWYLDDIRLNASRAPGGSLALGRSTRVAGQLVDSGEVTARLNLANLTPGTEYAVMTKWNSVQGTDATTPAAGVTTYLSIDHLFDAAAPANPILTSPTHTPGVWSQAGQVDVRWSGAADEVGGAGVAGYSTVFDAIAGTTPDATIEVAHGTDPHSFTSASLADGGSYYFHLRTCDFAQNCSGPVHLGPFRIDRTAPSVVGNLTSPSHAIGVPSSDPTVDVTWSAATDASSGVDGYAFAFDGNVAWTCDQVKDAEETAAGTSSPPLAGGAWYFHACTRDNAGNWSSVVTSGPYSIIATTGALSGRLTDAGSMAGIPGATVLAYGASGSQAGQGVTDAQGSYQVASLPPGSYYAKTLAAGYFDELFDAKACPLGACSVTTGSPIAVTAGATTPSIDFALTPSAVRLHTLSPCRLIDTRGTAAPLGGPALVAGGVRIFDADTGCAIPATARALSVNVTVVGPTGPGDLRLYPPGGGVPLASTINYGAGQTRANSAVLPLNGSRQFAVRCDQAAGSVHLLVDVNGYFE